MFDDGQSKVKVNASLPARRYEFVRFMNAILNTAKNRPADSWSDFLRDGVGREDFQAILQANLFIITRHSAVFRHIRDTVLEKMQSASLAELGVDTEKWRRQFEQNMGEMGLPLPPDSWGRDERSIQRFSSASIEDAPPGALRRHARLANAWRRARA